MGSINARPCTELRCRGEAEFASDDKSSVETGTVTDSMMEIVFMGLQENGCVTRKLTESSMKGRVYNHIFCRIVVVTNCDP